ncbi:cbb3-type cytochrome oxidase assembly protein CcoS [Kangiella sp. TOML190]|uniref:cbb3-type cytochrome oxidase assembly protein CcoS n=1 Tax=Kangiella sp. TOML190 TaxID=2931351 RepID=UPI002041BB08|nr:cbb3-type cytochrome oxidase assembly protein CcoS [Kangiella sp. TOML190]
MNAIYFLIPLTLVLLAAAVALFFWAVNSDQYSDLDKESQQILFDDDKSDSHSKSHPQKAQNKDQDDAES